MAAFACLRVELPPAWAERLEAFHGQLEKVVESCLESRWSWPRRFEHIVDLSFLLTDPRLSAPPAGELGQLADHLQHHLFGGSGEGEVSLLLFEGPEEAAAAFSRFSAEEVAAAIADPERLPPGGRLMRLRPGAAPVVEALSAAVRSPPPAAAAPVPPAAEAGCAARGQRVRPGVVGTYLLTREAFVGEVLAIAPDGGGRRFSVVEDEGLLPPDEGAFDEACCRAAAGMLAHRAGGLPLGVPIAYSHFVRAGQLARLRAMLQLLPGDRREQLAAQVYGAPRPMPHGVDPFRPLLEAHFGAIGLVTFEPGFEIDLLAPHSVASLALCLHESVPHVRQAAICAFGERAEAYRLRGIRQVVANVRTRAELELCARRGLHLVSGPAVGGFREAPFADHAAPLAHVQVRGA